MTSILTLLLFDWLFWPVWAGLYFSGSISYLMWHIIMNGPVIAMSAVGLSFYAVDRKNFWNKAEWNKTMLILASILFSLGVSTFFFNADGFSEMVDRPLFHSQAMNLGEPLASFLPMVWSSLWIITGALWFLDGLLRPHKRDIIGAMIAITSSVALLNLDLFKVVMGGGTTNRFYYYFLGYTTHLAISSGLVLLTISGIVVFVYYFRTRMLVGN